jgi:hypothetical protein
MPIEVIKNFSEDNGERNIYNIDDPEYSEAILPLLVKAGEESQYKLLNLYQNWGNFPLKQISAIQYSSPYYHLSTGVTESNCITPWFFPRKNNHLKYSTLPDFRAASAPFWASQPQHTGSGLHNFLRYTSTEGDYNASDSLTEYIDSYGPTYCDLTMTFRDYDEKMKMTYTHTEMPQTDENRAYYEMRFEVLKDISIKDFKNDFKFYSVKNNYDQESVYTQFGYLNSDNKPTVANANMANSASYYVLGNECPYFDYFNIPDYTDKTLGYVNLSFIVYSYEFVINGEKSDASFIVKDHQNTASLSLDLSEVQLKAGDYFIINAILMPWGSQESDYTAAEPDANVREVRRNTLLDPLTPIANENCEIIESVFVPRIRSTNGKSAEFTLTGGHNNIAFRVYGFDTLTVPVIEEFVDGKWVEYKISSINSPDSHGLGYAYDGYMVYYDGDGTYSYSFITTMDNGQARTFRVTAENEFTGWEKEDADLIEISNEDPINVFVDASELYEFTSNRSDLSKVELLENGAYVRLYTIDDADRGEVYITPMSSEMIKYQNLTSTGQYLVLKYRLPSGIAKSNNFEFFTSTQNGRAQNGDNYQVHNLPHDDMWHVLIIDYSYTRPKTFIASNDGTYLANYLRFDIYNNAFTTTDMYIDVAFIGLSDSLEDIMKLVDENDIVNSILKPEGFEEEAEKETEPATVMEFENIKDSVDKFVDPASPYKVSNVKYASTLDMLNGGERITKVFNQSDKVFTVVHYYGKTLSEAKLLFSGWALVEGGIEDYIWSVDGGKTWQSAKLLNVGGVWSAGDAHLNTAESRLGITLDREASKAMCNFQGAIGRGENSSGLYADLSAYIGETVSVTFAAIPKNQPDSICIIAHVTDVEVVE